MNGGAAVPRLRMDAPNALRALCKSLIPPNGGCKEERSRAKPAGALLRPILIAAMPRRLCRGLAAPGGGGRMSRLIATINSTSRFAGISAAAIYVVGCSQTGEPRLPFSPARWQGRFRQASVPNVRTPSLLADEILFDQKSVTAAIDSTERACGRRPCR
jgi:hypothetical protein